MGFEEEVCSTSILPMYALVSRILFSLVFFKKRQFLQSMFKGLRLLDAVRRKTLLQIYNLSLTDLLGKHCSLGVLTLHGPRGIIGKK